MTCDIFKHLFTIESMATRQLSSGVNPLSGPAGLRLHALLKRIPP
ncbi:hypothetical protein LINGRAHAP2_LOCUS30440 [Linum grandiflorum]